MGRDRIRIWIAGLCLTAVCVFITGCQCPDEKTTTCTLAKTPEPSVERLGPYGFMTDWTDEEGFITNWLIVGPFPNPGERPDNAGFHVDYLKNYGGEAGHIPADGTEIAKDDGTMVKWQQYKSQDDIRVNFFDAEHLDLGYETEDILVYAACWLECYQDVDVEIRVGSDDGYKLWVDHKLIGEEHVYRAAAIDQESYPITLSEGMHLILIKVDQDYGGFEFVMRVVTPDHRKIPEIKVWN